MAPNLNTVGTVRIEVGPTKNRPVNTLVFPVNPNQQYDRDIRVTVTQTEGGFYSDDYGMGIPTLQLAGSTAFESSKGKFNGQYVDGNEAGKHFYRDIILYYFNREATDKGKTVMWVYDDVFGRAWETKPIGKMQTTRDANDPMVIHYQQEFLVLQDYPFKVTQKKIPDPIIALNTPKPSHRASNTAQKVKKTPYHIYTVKSGDNIWDILKNYYLPKGATNAEIERMMHEVEKLNPLPNPNLIFAGQKLKIP